MNIVVGLLIVGIIVAIMFLSRGSSDKKESRKKYLRDLTHFVGGTLESFEGHEDSYRISFLHAGLQFVYEDIKEHGLGERVYS